MIQQVISIDVQKILFQEEQTITDAAAEKSVGRIYMDKLNALAKYLALKI